MEIDFDYEPEAFVLSNGVRYLPDFWIPQIRMFAEVKPAAPTDKEFQKAILLSHGTGHSVLFLDGPPDFRAYEGATWDCGFYTRAMYSLDIDDHHRRQLYDAGRLFSDPDLITEQDCSERYREAVYASRAARFEDEANA